MVMILSYSMGGMPILAKTPLGLKESNAAYIQIKKSFQVKSHDLLLDNSSGKKFKAAQEE
jgi:hypothetical protein